MRQIRIKRLILCFLLIVSLNSVWMTFAQDEDAIEIALITNIDDLFFRELVQGAQLMADESNIHFEHFLVETEVDAATEQSTIRELIEAAYDAIIISTKEPFNSVPAIQEAHEAGIPVICVNTCINDDDRELFVFAFFQTDQFALGYQTGEYVAQWSEIMNIEMVNLGILNCEVFEACRLRGEGFRSALSVNGVDWTIIANQEGFIFEPALPVAEAMIEDHPQINVVWSENEGGTLAIAQAVVNTGKVGDVFAFGTDITQQIATFLLDENNVLQASNGQAPRIMGMQGVRAALAALDGQERYGDNIISTDFYFRDNPERINIFLDAQEE